MDSFRKIISTMLLVLLSVTYLFSGTVQAAAEPQPPIMGKYGIVIDATTGEVLYNKDGDARAYPASMTKVLTAIVMDQKAKYNQIFTASANAAGQECSCFGLKAGEKISMKDAMYGLLLLSANDLAVAIAENMAGSVPAFAQLMNAEVKKLGLKNTHFVTPNGLHDPNHYTTPHDMALIMKEALKHPQVLKVLSTQTVQVHTSLGERTISNTSEVHIQPPSAHVIAGKTGYTDQAGNTLVEYLKEGNKAVIAVVMKTHKIYQYHDIQTMANYAFAHMISKTIATKGEVMENTKINGEKVSLISREDLMLTFKTGDTPVTKIDLAATNKTNKDIKKGQVVADLKVINDGAVVKEIPLMTNKEIKQIPVHVKKSSITDNISIPVGIILIAALFVVLTNLKNAEKRRKLKKQESPYSRKRHSL